MGHVAGENRDQANLFPVRLDEVVACDNPVRVIDAFVDRLDLVALGFSNAVAEATGRPGYAAGDLLKLYVYGYLNRVRSSRRLARECDRNVEVMWLIGRLSPCFKTIADFRKDHAEAIVKVCGSFMQFCRTQSLFGGELVAIDGTKIEAVASRKQVITPQSVARDIERYDRRIAEYLEQMDEADHEEGEVPANGPAVTAALEELRSKRSKAMDQAKLLADQKLSQLVLSEREARLMRTARHAHQVAYNAQSAVDARHGLIACFELTNAGNDLAQLLPMALMAKQALGAETLRVVADTGYCNGEQGEACAGAGITAIVPRPKLVNSGHAQGFSRDSFVYDAHADTYTCPAGETLALRDTQTSDGRKRYFAKNCKTCTLKPQCTKASNRTIIRDLYEDTRQAMHDRAAADPGYMLKRRCLAEHPFGTMKWLMAYPVFLVRGLKKAKAELALTVMAFNFKRAVTILGVPHLLKALRPAFQ